MRRRLREVRRGGRYRRRGCGHHWGVGAAAWGRPPWPVACRLWVSVASRAWRRDSTSPTTD